MIRRLSTAMMLLEVGEVNVLLGASGMHCSSSGESHLVKNCDGI